jgi:hypothetical protein
MWLLLACLLGASGCARTPEQPAVDEEPRVRARFEELQQALKERDPEQINRLLAIPSQADAQGVARHYRFEFSRADDKGRAAYTEELGITLDDMRRFNGPMVFKTKPFLARYRDIRDGMFERASVLGDNATVDFRTEDGERDRLSLVQENGEWRFLLTMPPVISVSGDKKQDQPTKSTSPPR